MSPEELSVFLRIAVALERLADQVTPESGTRNFAEKHCNAVGTIATWTSGAVWLSYSGYCNGIQATQSVFEPLPHEEAKP